MFRQFLRLLGLLLVVAPSTTRAHFVWIDSVDRPTGETEVCVSFAEEPGPGADHLLDRIGGAESWIRRSGGAPAPLSLRAWKDAHASLGALVTIVSVRENFQVDTVCRYGVFQRGETSLLLNYSAKHARLRRSDDLSSVARSEKLELDITPQLRDGQLWLRVTWQGEPLAGCELTLLGDGGETTEATSDELGRVPAQLTGGRLVCRACRIDESARGEVDGKKYTQAWNIATLTVRLDEQAEVALASANESTTGGEVKADDALKAAREHRALWHDFPGFSARLCLQIESQQSQGVIRVNSQGEVKFEGLDNMDTDLLQQQLDSLVSHRLPDTNVEGAAIWDDAAPAEHVLGRRMVLEGNAMGSAYRVREHAVREVERQLGPSGRFVISVLDLEWNAEGKYLPTTFVVSTWTGNEQQLSSSLLVRQTWRHVKSFDLPATLVIVQANERGRTVIDCKFTDHVLGTDAPVTADDDENATR